MGRVSPRGIEWNPEEEGGTPAGGQKRGSHSGVRVGYTLGGPHQALGTLVTQADPAHAHWEEVARETDLKGVLCQEPAAGAMGQSRSREGVGEGWNLRVTQ